MKFKLGRPSKTEVSRRTNYLSDCGLYRVTRVQFVCGCGCMPEVWQACIAKYSPAGRTWLLLRDYRARASAEKCCRLHARTGQVYVPPKRKRKAKA